MAADVETGTTGPKIPRYPNAFTSSAFNAFEDKKIPVRNVLHEVRLIIGIKLFVQTTCAVNIYIFDVCFGWLVFLLAFLIVGILGELYSAFCVWRGKKVASSENAPILKRFWKGYKESFKTFFSDLPVKLWEHVFAKLFLRWQLTSAVWWYFYMLLSRAKDFETNYIAAWKEQMPEKVNNFEVTICIGEEEMRIPISGAEINSPNDIELISHLRMYFRLLRLKRGLSELIIPKLLRRVDCVLVGSDKGVDSNWEMVDSLKLGTTKGGLEYFHEPRAASDSQDLSKQLRPLLEKYAKENAKEKRTFRLEFLREFDRAQFAGIIMAPLIASLCFFTIWTVVSLHYKQGAQTTITTALTGATYLVTAGALITALVAYFDKKMEDEDPRASFKEILAQQAQPVAIARSKELDKVTSQLNQLIYLIATNKGNTPEGRPNTAR